MIARRDRLAAATMLVSVVIVEIDLNGGYRAATPLRRRNMQGESE